MISPRRRVAGLLAGLAAFLLAACGGGGDGAGIQTVVITVAFSYADVQADVRQPLSIVPILAGLDGHAPVCTVTSGALPPGIVLDGSTCVLSGTPSAAGLFSVAVTLTSKDVEGSVVAAANLRIADPTPTLVRVNPVPSGPLLTHLSLQFGQPLAPTALATIDPATYVARLGDTIAYAVVAGTLPSGISFDPATSAVHGTPTGFGISTIQLAVMLTRHGVVYTSAPVTLTLGVSALSLSVSYPSCLVGVGTVVTCTPQLNNPAAFVGLTVSYTATGLPAGVTIDPANGVLSGLLITAGDVAVPVTLRATYPGGAIVDVPTVATLRAAPILPFYDPSAANFGLASGPSTDGLGNLTAQLRSGQAFSISVTGYNTSLPGDVHAFTLLPFDAGTPLPPWLSIDASTGRLFGVTPFGLLSATWRIRVVTSRGGIAYSVDRPWVVTFM